MMTAEDRVKALMAKHAELEGAIVSESSRPHPDDAVVSDLKKQKLRIKDEIVKLTHS
jgi:hypothetical protein